jgi:hypothetical protein
MLACLQRPGMLACVAGMLACVEASMRWRGAERLPGTKDCRDTARLLPHVTPGAQGRQRCPFAPGVTCVAYGNGA